MEKVVISVEVPKEMQEAAQAVVNMAAAAKLALADGFQPGQDIPALVSAAMANLMSAMDGMAKIPDEAKADPVSAAKCAALAGAEIASLFMQK